MGENKDIPAAAKDTSPPQETVPDLKALREARGLSLTDIFEKTRVTLINLAAVENREFHRLPPPVYAKNFIRKYALSVGIDEKPILDGYETYLQSLKPTVGETEIQKPWPETAGRYRFLFASLAAVIVAGALVSALFLYDRAVKPASAPPGVDSPSPAAVITGPAPTAALPASAPQATTPGSIAPPGAAIQPPAAAGRKYPLVIEARERTWIRITEDRNPTYEALLKPGDKIERTASDYFQLDIGNAGGIDLTFQGKPLGSPGKRGQVIHMRLPEQVSDRKTP